MTYFSHAHLQNKFTHIWHLHTHTIMQKIMTNSNTQANVTHKHIDTLVNPYTETKALRHKNIYT